MAVKSFSKQSPETRPPQFYKVSLLNWLLYSIASIFNFAKTNLHYIFLLQESRPAQKLGNIFPQEYFIFHSEYILASNYSNCM